MSLTSTYKTIPAWGHLIVAPYRAPFLFHSLINKETAAIAKDRILYQHV